MTGPLPGGGTLLCAHPARARGCVVRRKRLSCAGGGAVVACRARGLQNAWTPGASARFERSALDEPRVAVERGGHRRAVEALHPAARPPHDELLGRTQI